MGLGPAGRRASRVAEYQHRGRELYFVTTFSSVQSIAIHSPAARAGNDESFCIVTV
jgi:hypothetical protein